MQRVIRGMPLFFITKTKQVKTKIFEQLKNKYSNLGFSNEVLEGVATQLSTFITEEEKIATAVAGAESMLKSFQSFADSRVNSFQKESSKYKTEAEQLKARLAELEKSDEPTEDPKTDDALLKMLSELSNEVKGLKKEREKDSKLEIAKKLLGNSQLPKSIQEKRLKYINLDGDLTEQIKDFEAEYEAIKEEAIKGVSKGLPLGGRVDDTEVSQDKADAIIDDI